MRRTGFRKAIDNLVEWSDREEWRPYREHVFAEHIGPIRDEYDIGEEDIADRLGPGFVMLYGCMLDDFFTARFGDEGDKNVIDDYLKRRGWREKAPAKRYLEALRDSFLSIYEVVALDPGRSMTVRDLVLGGDPVTIEEKSGSETAARWDRIAARVVTVNNKLHFTGGLLLLPHEMADEIVAEIELAVKDTMKALRKEARKLGEPLGLDEADLRVMMLHESPAMIIELWLVDALERAMAPPPEIRNTDGDALVFSEARFPLLGDAAKTIAALEGIEEVERDDDEGLHWIWFAPDSQPRRASQGEGMVIRTENEAGRTILGNIEIAGDTLVLSTNSEARAERGRALLMRHLEGLLDRPLTSHRTLEQIRSEGSDSAPEQFELPIELAEQALDTVLDSHYRQTLDSPLPYLEGKTPRQAARTKKGRGRAESWLKQLENSDARRAAREGKQPYDFRWMWRELGLGYPGADEGRPGLHAP